MDNSWTTGAMCTRALCVWRIGRQSSCLVARFKEESSHKPLDCVQEYNTSTHQCTVLIQRIPQSAVFLIDLRAVLWDKSVILVNEYTCFIFDPDQKTFQLRDQFAAGVSNCALALDNQTLFIIGGRRGLFDNEGEVTGFEHMGEVKSISVMDIINNQQTVNWTQRAKLKSPSFIDAFVCMTLPCS